MTITLHMKDGSKVDIRWVENFQFSGDTAMVKTYGNEPVPTRAVDSIEGSTNHTAPARQKRTS